MKNFIVILFFMVAFVSNANGEEPTPASETTEEIAEEVAPIPVEKVEEIEGSKEAKDEPKEEEKSDIKSDEKEEKEEKEEKSKEAIPETDLEAMKDTVALWKAIQSQDWSLAAGFLVMLLVYVFNRFGLKDKVGAKAIPFVTIAIGILSAIGVALASGGSIPAALEAGVLTGLAAIGSWEAVFKKMLGGSEESKEAKEA